MVNREPPKADADKKLAPSHSIVQKIKARFHKIPDFIRKKGESIDSRNDAERRAFWKDLPLLLSGLFSKDPPTRRVSILFFLASFLICVIPLIALDRYFHKRSVVAQKKAKILMQRALAEEEKKSLIEKRNESRISLGSYVVTLKDRPNQSHYSKIENLAELEIVVVCDGKETRDFMAASKVRVRSHLLSVLTTLDREELLSKEGKKRLREMLKRSLNDWLSEGKILELYFSKVVVG